MNIRYLNEFLSRMEEIAVIGRTAKVDGVICNIMGMVRNGLQLRLLILQYDENFQHNVEEDETAFCDIPSRPENNRKRLSRKMHHDAVNPFWTVRKILVGDREFEVNGAENHRLNIQNCEDILLISEFLHNGWQPKGIDYQNIDMLFLTSLELEGEYTAIPGLLENSELRFSMRADSVPYLVEQPITLTVGGQYPDRLWFRDLCDKEHWFLINQIYLSDMWAEIEKTLNDPRIQEQMTKEQIAQAKLDFEKKFLKICPKGMLLPVIEYECEENIALQFYTKDYLDAEPVNKNGGIGFIVRPENPTGILGLKLKAAIVQEPVPANTVSIVAELFQYFHTITVDDIVVK